MNADDSFCSTDANLDLLAPTPSPDSSGHESDDLPTPPHSASSAGNKSSFSIAEILGSSSASSHTSYPHHKNDRQVLSPDDRGSLNSPILDGGAHLVRPKALRETGIPVSGVGGAGLPPGHWCGSPPGAAALQYAYGTSPGMPVWSSWCQAAAFGRPNIPGKFSISYFLKIFFLSNNFCIYKKQFCTKKKRKIKNTNHLVHCRSE